MIAFRRLLYRVGLILAALGLLKIGLRVIALAKQANPWATCLRPHTPGYPDLSATVESLEADLRWHKHKIAEMEQGNAVLRREHADYIEALKVTHRDEIKGMRGGR